MFRSVRRVVCGISGGVDSAVAAFLLKAKGYDVVGLYMKNWDIADETGVCTTDADWEDAHFTCKSLGIPLHDVNFVKEYWNNVFCSLLNDYQRGVTPNPDVLCNKYIKFDAFLKHAVTNLGADAIATGHYAQTSAGYDLEAIDPAIGVKLLQAVDKKKDQTLFLSQISQDSLRKTLFPIGDLTKDAVRKIAVSAGLEKIAKRKEVKGRTQKMMSSRTRVHQGELAGIHISRDIVRTKLVSWFCIEDHNGMVKGRTLGYIKSMGICFIGSRNFRNFIEEYLEPRPGKFVDVETGKELGCHNGTHYWTLGQRALISGMRHAYFVSSIDVTKNELKVAEGTKHPALFSQSFTTDRAHWIQRPPEALIRDPDFDLHFRFQHEQPLIDCTATLCDDGRLNVSLSQPVRALTLGQFAVFYQDNECLGSAKIIRSGPTLYELKSRLQSNAAEEVS